MARAAVADTSFMFMPAIEMIVDALKRATRAERTDGQGCQTTRRSSVGSTAARAQGELRIQATTSAAVSGLLR
jgi:hypothetical protein